MREGDAGRRRDVLSAGDVSQHSKSFCTHILNISFGLTFLLPPAPFWPREMYK